MWRLTRFWGFSADAPVYREGALAGVQLRDVGIGKDGKEKDTFEPGEELDFRRVKWASERFVTISPVRKHA